MIFHLSFASLSMLDPAESLYCNIINLLETCLFFDLALSKLFGYYLSLLISELPVFFVLFDLFFQLMVTAAVNLHQCSSTEASEEQEIMIINVSVL